MMTRCQCVYLSACGRPCHTTRRAEVERDSATDMRAEDAEPSVNACCTTDGSRPSQSGQVSRPI
jgi:hypothetical protein